MPTQGGKRVRVRPWRYHRRATRKSIGATILARTLEDRRALLRNVVRGSSVQGTSRWCLTLRNRDE